MTKYKPTQNYICIEKPSIDETEAGIKLLDAEIKRREEEFFKTYTGAKVLKIGPEVKEIKVGDVVMPSLYGKPQWLQDCGVLRESDISVIYED